MSSPVGSPTFSMLPSGDWWRKRALPVLKTRLLGLWANAMRWRGADVMDEEWDTLLLLDACRYDMFEAHHTFDWVLESRISKGASTHEFLRHNFRDGRDHYDTVYVTANPMYRVDEWVGTAIEGRFHAIVDVWRDSWDEELHTVRPDAVSQATLKAIEQYPNKRLLVHFMQPHYPFIGPTGRERIDGQDNLDIARRRAQGEHRETRKDVWDRLVDGDLSQDVVWESYVENLEITLPHLHTLVDAVDGRTVISSDHGNMLGERAWPLPFRVYGHPQNVHTKELRKVPWMVFDGGQRRSVRADPPEAKGDVVSDIVKDRLGDLGYY